MILRPDLQTLVIIGFFLLLGSPIISVAAESAASEEPVQAEYFEDGDAVLDMDGMAVTGNQELPKSLMIVPWQEPGTGDLFGGEFESLIDIDPETIDRTEFKRELDYYRVRTGQKLDAAGD